MWLVIVSILACFDINKAKDEAGNEIEPDGTYLDQGVIRYVVTLNLRHFKKLMLG